MLIRPGVLFHREKAATSGFTAERFFAYNRHGVGVPVLIGAVRHNGMFKYVMRWAENQNDQHFLLTPSYTPLSMTVRGRTGDIQFTEPVEVSSRAGWHVYIGKVSLNHSGKQYQLMR